MMNIDRLASGKGSDEDDERSRGRSACAPCADAKATGCEAVK